MDVAEWQKRLEDNFSVKGVVGGNLAEVLELEKTCRGQFFRTFRGQSVLVRSFQSFFIETLKNARNWVNSNGWPRDCPSYHYICLYYFVMFRRIRACEIVFINGYPFDGYALLRGLKDLAIHLGGIVHNLTTISRILGADEGQKPTEEYFRQVSKLQAAEENKVKDHLTGNRSGLPQEVVQKLRNWEKSFHQEVHGSRFSISHDASRWERGEAEPPIGPRLPGKTASSWQYYMDQAAEVYWLIVRLLPYLQPTEAAFGEEWLHRYEILDDCFRFSEQSRDENYKKTGEAFMAFVDQKFSFRQPFYYSEADGSRGR